MSGPYRRPQADIYTALLAIALVAVLLATIFAYLETSEYGEQKYRGAPPVPAVLLVDRPGIAPCGSVWARPEATALRHAPSGLS
jgi:hypothetical protein